jgi:7tm Chemosensory receptor
VSKVFGLTSFTIKQDKRRKLRAAVSISNIFCLLVATVWFITNFLQFFLADDPWEVNRDYISEFFETFVSVNICCDLVTIVSTSWLLFFLRHKLVNILRMLTDIDDSLAEHGVEINYSKHKKTIIAMVVIVKAFNVSGILLSYVFGHLTDIYTPSLFSSLSELSGYEMYTLFFLQFILFMWAVKIRFAHINVCLEQLHDRKKRQQDLECCDILNLSALHDKLVTITEKLSFCYGLPVRET